MSNAGQSDQLDLHERDKRRIIERLTSAGWKMAEGATILNRASLVYESEQLSLEVTQDDQYRELLLTLVSADGGELTVFPAYGERLDATLEAIIGFQDRISPDNFQDMLRELVAACPEVYFQTEEDDEPRLLTAD
ncbi:hypothetical protein [Micromonospora sp. NPDC048830]|uniref:hypothetical protein n=1 Tax=Micromonospora sp. NPDC048830 TaxID=3364257 RepID=UPI003717A338